MLKKSIILLSLFTILFSLISCGSDFSLVGKWYKVKEVDGTRPVCYFKDDNTFTLYLRGKKFSYGTYSFKQSKHGSLWLLSITIANMNNMKKKYVMSKYENKDGVMLKDLNGRFNLFRSK